MRRAMLVMKNLGPDDPAARFDHPPDVSLSSYDHPYFGQIFLAGALGIIGYPSSLNPSAGNVHSIEMLYLVPRVLMGLLAVLDTFLLYKIAEYRYGRNVALAASVVFAVMPLSWLLRWILLDSILLPFLLASILLALYIKQPKRPDERAKLYTNDNDRSIKIPILLSGILLGLAIYTKIPAFTMIPLVGFLVYKNSNRSLKALGLWFIPVILIPAMWPAYSISVGQFDEWSDGFLHQTHRMGTAVLDSATAVYQIDPLLITLGTAGVVLSAIKRDLFYLLWILPFVAFSIGIGYVQYFHVILLLPAFSMGIGLLLETTIRNITKKKVLQKYLMFSSIVAIGIFGLVSISMIITLNVNSSYFGISAFIVQHLMPPKILGNENIRVTMISNHWWTYNSLWIPVYIFDKNVEFVKPIAPVVKNLEKNDRILMVIDHPLMDTISQNSSVSPTSPNHSREVLGILNAFNLTREVATFTDSVNPSNLEGYPYTSLANMILNEQRPLGRIDVRQSALTN
jgi:uncharacterized SAM-binding protein YcdF (DUF218 family)